MVSLGVMVEASSESSGMPVSVTVVPFAAAGIAAKSEHITVGNSLYLPLVLCKTNLAAQQCWDSISD